MLFSFVAGTAWAGPPLVTDDPDTPGPNHWEINIATVAERVGGDWIMGAPLLDLNYGVGESIQLKFQTQYNILKPDSGGGSSGMGNSLAGVKWRFLDQTNGSWLEISTYPQVEFIVPSSSVQRGLADAGDNLLIPIEIEHKFDKLTMYAEAGYVWNEKEPASEFFGIAGEYELTEKFSVMGEVYGGFDQEFGKTGLSFNLGFHRTLTEHVALIGAAGRGIFGPDDRNPGFASYLGVQLTY